VRSRGASPSLYLGRYEGDRLLYAGKAQSGYTLPIVEEVPKRLDPIHRRALAPDRSSQQTESHLDRAESPGGDRVQRRADDGLSRALVLKGAKRRCKASVAGTGARLAVESLNAATADGAAEQTAIESVKPCPKK
jgi:hypothetical protein